MEKITLVLTSCGRPHLLKRTLASFNSVNNFIFEKKIIIDDSGDPKMKEYIQNEFSDFFDITIFNKKRLGQIKSIDKAYAHVDTPYIFHCEDDWFFFRGNFIQDSLSILYSDEKIISVWMRDLWDTNGCPIERRILKSPDGVMYRKIDNSQSKSWNGFTFNPSIIRLSDYKKIAPYNDIGLEKDIDIIFRKKGYYGVILEEGVVKHIGDDEHIPLKENKWSRKIKRILFLLSPPLFTNFIKQFNKNNY